ncbi:MAG: STT3 domain-containing protein, partial [Haloarculaceae archaeon]
MDWEEGDLADLAASKADLEADLAAILERDAAGPWTFEEVPVETGVFGELVDGGVVEYSGSDRYRLTDPAALRDVLDGRADRPGDETAARHARTGDETAATWQPRLSARWAAVRRRLPMAGWLLVVIAVTVLVRTVTAVGAVFRDGTVVLSSNDPYWYRYWLDTLLASDLPALSLGALANLPGELPSHDVLTTVLLWWLAAIGGGDPRAVGLVLAWYPVVAGCLTVLGTYLVATRVYRDRRVGIASALTLAVLPMYALRTGLGFGDHHAFDFVWLVTTLYALVSLLDGQSTRDPLARVRDRWPAVVLLGVGVTGQVAAWRGGPLLVLPIAGLTLAGLLSTLRTDRSPLAFAAPIAAGVSLSAGVTLGLRLGFGWLPAYRAGAPALLAIGIVAVATSADWLDRRDAGLRALLGVWVVLGLVGGVGVALVAPRFPAAVVEFVSYHGEVRAQNIAETYSLFSPANGLVRQPLFFFGLVIFLALAYLGWATYRVARLHRPRLLALVVYGWYLLALSLLEVRFAGEWSLLVAVFAGLGFVHLVSVVDIGRPPPLDRGSADSEATLLSPGRVELRSALQVVALFVLVNGLSVVLAPALVADHQVDRPTYETAATADAYATTHDLAYPADYVFSPWATNRVYNYYVNGESKEYGYALLHHEDFRAARSGPDWYERLRDRVGFVVVESETGTYPGTLQHRLFRRFWRGDGAVPRLGHYRAVHAEAESHVLYALVPGARLVGQAPPNAKITAATTVTVSGGSMTYRRTVDSGPDGAFATTVA